MKTLYHLVLFVGDPVMAILGFSMFCFPLAWAKMNAGVAHKELREFNSPKQLASTRRNGALLMMLAVLSFLSLLATNAIVPLK